MAEPADLWEVYTGPEFTGERALSAAIPEELMQVDMAAGTPVAPASFPQYLRGMVARGGPTFPASYHKGGMSDPISADMLRRWPRSTGPGLGIPPSLANPRGGGIPSSLDDFLDFLRGILSKPKPPAPRAAPEIPPPRASQAQQGWLRQDGTRTQTPYADLFKSEVPLDSGPL